MKTFLAAAAVVLAVSTATATAHAAPSQGHYCHSEALGLSLTVWRDEQGSLLNALVEREADGFSHYMACWDADASQAPVVGDCYAVLLVDSYDATLVAKPDGTLAARLTRVKGPIGGPREDVGELACE